MNEKQKTFIEDSMIEVVINQDIRTDENPDTIAERVSQTLTQVDFERREREWHEQNAGTRNERTIEVLGEEILKIGIRQQVLARAIEDRELFLEDQAEGHRRVLVVGMTNNIMRARIEASLSPALEVSTERLLRISDGHITHIFSGEEYAGPQKIHARSFGEDLPRRKEMK